MIDWEKPKKVISAGEHATMHSSDSGIPGTYVPNMSKEDAYSWKGKVVKTRTHGHQVELRKTTSNACILLIVSVEDGYKHGFYGSNKDRKGTDGLNIHLSTNGPIQLTFEQFDDFTGVVRLAKNRLLELDDEK